ncbi:MAG: hypothetical protein ABI480_19035 [Chitinophagaceae bacterium]
MKIIILSHLCLLLVYGCRQVAVKDEVKSFAAGTYIRYSEHEFGNEYDTVCISLLNENTGDYKIMRKWKYERVLDGNRLEPEYKKQVTSGLYSVKYKMIRELETGIVITFDIQARTLMMNTTKYKKI